VHGRLLAVVEVHVNVEDVVDVVDLVIFRMFAGLHLHWLGIARLSSGLSIAFFDKEYF
jgi:hypothetical protein